MKKNRIIVFSTLIFILSFSVFFVTSEWTFPSLWGSHSLGNNLYMLDWEKGSKIIVFCSFKRGETCYGGTPIIPDTDNTHQMRIKDVAFNTKWIIVKTLYYEDSKELYYIIDKNFPPDSLSTSDDVRNYIIGPLEIEPFLHELKIKNIRLKF